MIKMKTSNKSKKAIRYLILTLTLVFACSVFSLSAFAIGAEEKTASEQVTKQPDTNVVIGTNPGESKGAGVGGSSTSGTVKTPIIPTPPSSSSKISSSSKASSAPAYSKPAVSSKKSENNEDDSSEDESELTIVDLDPGASSRLASEVSSSAAVVKPAEVEGFFTPMLVGGIALVLLGLAGFGFFIYLQCFSKGNTMADITQQAKRDAKRYQRRK